MNTAEVAKKFEEMGWKNTLNYDRASTLALEDRTVDISWKLYSYGPGLPQSLYSRNFVILDWFNEVCDYILGRENKRAHFIREHYPHQVKADPVTPDMVEAAAEQAIAWAKEQDLDAQLQAYRTRPLHLTFDEYGISLLAAHALCGDIDQLRHYQERYAAGHLEEFGHGGRVHPNRLHINTETIARAIEYAEGVIARGEVRSPVVASGPSSG